MLTIGRDVTEQHRLEEQLRQAQKLEAIGQLAGGVAHDFNNLLTAILGFTELLASSLPPEDPGLDDLGEIKKAGERAAALTRQLLAFGRKQIVQPTVLDINAVIEGLEPMLRRLLMETVTLRIERDEPPGLVLMDATQIEQILINLAVNASDAMGRRGGTLTIRTAMASMPSGPGGDGVLPPGEYVLLVVTDTGSGMSEEVIAHIFEPFFTTKGPGKGTGLGLATVYGIVKQSGGDIRVHSEPGRGSTFEIVLPRVPVTDADAAGVTSRKGEVPSGSETILIVEDDGAVRRLTRMTLERRGYRALEASNPKEAERVAQDYEGRIHLVLSDVIMPESEGPPLVDRLAARQPGLRVLYMSGYADETIVQHGLLVEGTSFVQKPFSPETLLRKVREMLG